ncbi:MAG: hypothetical protein CUN50_00415 [Candidatus Thermofonsia Clade 1 bacterium]|uniref:DUF3352 domain-containing protein n=3 Tax=Candidatus Thermofonsia Clade 1 bacterium TaxID=2364210 RepID=A0A2M8Q0U4_9CHLR|nr:MAG: hypothetical protein CUN50_00415 [Candidatus Thermofonsia Clade 1 bacterium]
MPRAAAQDDALDVTTIATLFSSAEFFVAVRTDQRFADQLDAISVALSSGLAAERVQLSELVDALLGEGVYSLSRLVNARFAALSLNGLAYLVDADSTNDQRADLRMVIGHGLGRLGRAILPTLQRLAGLRCQAEPERTTCYFEQAGLFKTLSVDERHIILLSQPEAPLYPTETLAAQPDFTAALKDLPERAYDGYAFINTPYFAARIRYEGIRELLSALGFPPDALSAAMLGLKLTDEGLQLDAVQRRSVQPRANSAPLDLNFARFMPETVAIYLQTHDLSQLAEIAAGLLGSLSATLSSQEAYASLRQLFRSLFKLDLEGDLLSWARQSDYAVFVDTPDPSGNAPFDQLDLGFIISGDDPQRMAAVASGIADGLARQLRDQAGFAFERVTLPALDASVMQLSYTDAQFGALRFYIGSAPQFSFFATERSLRRILQGQTLDKRLDWSRLERYLLPRPSLLLHADADNATRFLFVLTETLAQLNIAQLGELRLPSASNALTQRFERAILSVNTSAESQVQLRLFLLLSG